MLTSPLFIEQNAKFETLEKKFWFCEYLQCDCEITLKNLPIEFLGMHTNIEKEIIMYMVSLEFRNILVDATINLFIYSHLFIATRNKLPATIYLLPELP